MGSTKKVASLSLRYEDLIDFKSRELTRISSFVEVEQKQLERTYDRQNQAPLSEKTLSIENERASFYNEMRHGHFINYFDRKSLKNFFNQHSKVITNCGYEYTLDT